MHSCSIRREIGEIWTDSTAFAVDQFLRRRLLDYSVPKDDPIHNAPSARDLRDAIYRKIVRSRVVVIPTGMYVNYSKWIQKEIDGAREKEKPVLGVNPWGQQRVSRVVADAADKLVGWRKKSVVDGIWNLYRK